MSDSHEAIATANMAFYEAHESRDMDAMAQVWEHAERVACTHPGWPTLHGWSEVGESWRRIFLGPGRNQFIITNQVVAVEGEVGWVTCDENLVDSGATGTVAATNVFVFQEGHWQMVAHHGSPVITS